MNTRAETRWMVCFWHSNGDIRSERSFPKFEFWHPNEEASQAEGRRVLNELRTGGDKRDWKAAGVPDPFEVGSGRHPGGSWILFGNCVRRSTR